MTAVALRRMSDTWRDFAGFVRRPGMATPVGLKAGWREAATMLALHLIGLAALLGLLTGWQALTGIEGPQAFDEFPAQWLFPVAVIAAPVLEEMVFRGWLSGRPRALWLLCCLAAGITVALARPDPSNFLVALTGGLAVAGIVWFVLRKRPAPAWFARHFAAIFFAGAVVFALVHLFNYANPGPAHLPMVLPQLWAGLTLGFVRTRVGLPAAMLVHGVSNALALGLAGLDG